MLGLRGASCGTREAIAAEPEGDRCLAQEAIAAVLEKR
jgi:hypothetical protein